MSKDLDKITKDDLLKGDSGSYFIKREIIEDLDPLRLEAFQSALIDTAYERGLELSVSEEFDKNGITVFWGPRQPKSEFEVLIETILKSSTGAYIIAITELPAGYQDVFKAVEEGEKRVISVEEVKNQSIVKIFWEPSEAWFVEKKSGNIFDVVPEKTFLQDLVQHMNTVPEGEVYVEKSVVFSEVENMEELGKFFQGISLTNVKTQITVTESLDLGAQLKIAWKPSK